MALSEFQLIQQYFSQQLVQSKYTRIGIGDDAAVFTIPPDFDVVTSVDISNEGIHFLENASAYDVGYKALAVSISDLAAMGAEPISALLTLCLPEADLGWLQDFAQGFFAMANACNVELIGGDITRGPLSIGTVVNGLVPAKQALLRSGAKAHDLIYVTGTLGDAGLALQLLAQEVQPIESALLARLNRPSPRWEIGMQLRGIASSAMDISDGLLLDLERLCVASQVGATLWSDRLPLSRFLQQKQFSAAALRLALTAGDDYELLVTVPQSSKGALEALKFKVPITCIGEIKSEEGVVVKDKAGKIASFATHGFDHFQ